MTTEKRVIPKSFWVCISAIVAYIAITVWLNFLSYKEYDEIRNRYFLFDEILTPLPYILTGIIIISLIGMLFSDFYMVAFVLAHVLPFAFLLTMYLEYYNDSYEMPFLVYDFILPIVVVSGVLLVILILISPIYRVLGIAAGVILSVYAGLSSIGDGGGLLLAFFASPIVLYGIYFLMCAIERKDKKPWNDKVKKAQSEIPDLTEYHRQKARELKDKNQNR